MIDERYRTNHEEFYGEPAPTLPSHRTKVAVWIALIGVCLSVWGAVIVLIIHLT